MLEHHKEERRREPRGNDHDDGPHDGRIRKGEVRNRWGRAGNPLKRKPIQAVPQQLDGLMHYLLQQEVSASVNGEPTRMTARQALFQKTLKDLFDAPIKLRLELLFSKKSVFRDMLERGAIEEDHAIWTPELEAQFRIIEEEYSVPDDGELNSRERMPTYEYGEQSDPQERIEPREGEEPNGLRRGVDDDEAHGHIPRGQRDHAATHDHDHDDDNDRDRDVDGRADDGSPRRRHDNE